MLMGNGVPADAPRRLSMARRRALFRSPDSRTVPVVCQQVDFSAGGDGMVARGDIRNINDLRIKNGKRKKVVLAQNSPSHYFIMSLLIDAGIDPGDIDFKWSADAPSAAKIFVQDPSYDAFVG